MRNTIPPIWLIILLVGLPQLSETLYTPALTEIARALSVNHARVEQTLTIYLFAFALGVLFWGRLSDYLGRKPCFIMGLIVFITGCFFCATATNITALMTGRFIQAFGGSIGSVLCQAVTRDSFTGPQLGRVYSMVGTALALFPTLGPIIGGFITEHHAWHYSFVLLAFLALILLLQVVFLLPETNHDRSKVSYLETFHKLISNKRVIAFGILVGVSNGMNFSFFAEGSFYMQALGLSPTLYGATFIIFGLCQMISGNLSRKLQGKINPMILVSRGIFLFLTSNLILTAAVFMTSSKEFLLIITIITQMMRGYGSIMVASNSLALALIDYKEGVGTASSLFGCYYYGLISLITLGMSILHNGKLLVMPIYFLFLSLLAFSVRFCMLK